MKDSTEIKKMMSTIKNGEFVSFGHARRFLQHVIGRQPKKLEPNQLLSISEMLSEVTERNELAEICYKVVLDKVMITGFKNILQLKDMDNSVKKFYTAEPPYFYLVEESKPKRLFLRLVIENETLTSTLTNPYPADRVRRDIRIGKIYDRKVFGKIISTIKEAGERFTTINRLIKSKNIKTVQI